MKKFLALALALVMVIGMLGAGSVKAAAEGMDDLIAAAQAEGTLIVYGSCEEDYLSAACEKFQELYGIEVKYQRLSTGEVQSKIEEENGRMAHGRRWKRRSMLWMQRATKSPI